MLQLPKPDMSNFCSVQAEIVAGYYIYCSKQALSLSMMQRNIRSLLSPAATDKAVSALIAKGEVVIEDKILRLTPSGKANTSKNLGRDANENWEVIKSRRLPLIILGLDPDSSDVLRKFARADAIKAGIITLSYALPSEMMASLKAVRSEIVWRVVRAGLSELVGKGPFPLIEKPGPMERTLLAGLAGVQAKSITEAINGVAARAVGLEKVDMTGLRERLIVIGIERSSQTVPTPREGKPHECEASQTGVNCHDDFVNKVMQVARDLSTPPFQGRVAIAQVYDAYGKIHPDAGSLSSFKLRLIDAADAKEIQLGRLDMPERMGKELRDRSETPWDTDKVHFVVTDWK